jgi:hypothetical protein
MNKIADPVREYVKKEYIEKARREGASRFAVVAGDVHRALRLQNRIAPVCYALKTRDFLDENGIRIVSTDGPPSGMSTTVKYTYEFENAAPRTPPSYGDPSIYDKLAEMQGLLSEVYRKLGGPEKAISEVRKELSR